MKTDNSGAVNPFKMEVLPREILCIIFSYLDKKSVRNATKTCALWFQLIRRDINLSGYISLEKVGPEQLFEKNLNWRMGLGTVASIENTQIWRLAFCQYSSNSVLLIKIGLL